MIKCLLIVRPISNCYVHPISNCQFFLLLTGHKDYYPNSGSMQPGCMMQACSHTRSWLLYGESVVYPHAFPAVRCEDWDAFKSGRCEPDMRYWKVLKGVKLPDPQLSSWPAWRAWARWLITVTEWHTFFVSATWGTRPPLMGKLRYPENCNFIQVIIFTPNRIERGELDRIRVKTPRTAGQ